MGDLSKDFSSHEFACKCGCGKQKMKPQLILRLQQLRNHFQAPIKITSGRRCHYWNDTIGGSRRSKHLEGIAVDIKVKGVSPKEVYDFLDTLYPDSCGLGLYRTFVHWDIRPDKARW